MPGQTEPGAPAADAVARSASIVRQADTIQISADSVGSLRRLSGQDTWSNVRAVEITVTTWEPPLPGWSGRLGPVRGLVQHQIRLPHGGTGPVAITMTLAEPAPLWRILAAVLPALEPRRPLPFPISSDVAVRGEAPSWLRPELISRRLTGGEPSDAVVRPYDMQLTGSPAGARNGYGAVLPMSPYGVNQGHGESILVDATAANPKGRQRFCPELPAGRLGLVQAGDGIWWQITEPGDTAALIVAGRAGDRLDERQGAALRRIGAALAGDDWADTPPAAQATAVAQLAVTGLVLYLPTLTEAVADLLASELVSVVRKPLPSADADPIEWELRSVAQRRAALRGHAAVFGLPSAASGTFGSLVRPPTVSALLVTRRPRRAVATVAALAGQTYPELDIVVGLHGCEATPEQLAQLTEHGRPVRILPIPGRLCFGEALGEATRSAQGSLIAKVDDDDRYGPEHLWDLVLARHYSGATVVGKGAEFVYVERRDLTVRRWMGSELYSEVVGGGTLLLSRGDLESVGGWRPLDRSVDRGLLDRVLGDGGLVYRTHGFGYIYTRHGDGHTWDPGVDYFLHDPRRRWAGLPPHEEFGVR